MKFIYLLIFLQFSVLHSQNSQWYDFDIDSLVVVSMPALEISEVDTIIQGMKIKNLYLTNGNHSFIAQRLTKITDNKIDLSSLPHDSISLNKFYLGMIEGMRNKRQFDIKTKEQIKKNGLLGYHVTLVDSLKNPVLDCQIFQLGTGTYSLTYLNYIDFDNQLSQYYRESLKINNPESISQFNGKNSSESLAFALGEMVGGIFVMGLLIFAAIKIFGK